jgi:hypothetical protein
MSGTLVTEIKQCKKLIMASIIPKQRERCLYTV